MCVFVCGREKERNRERKRERERERERERVRVRRGLMEVETSLCEGR